MSFQILWRVNPPENTHTHIVKLNAQIKQVDLNITPVGSLALADYNFLLSPQLIRFLVLSPLLEVWPFLHYNFPLSLIISGRHPYCKADLAMCCIIGKQSRLKHHQVTRVLFQTTLHWFPQLSRHLGYWRVHGGPGGAPPGLWWAWPAGTVRWSPGSPGCHRGGGQLPRGPERGGMQEGWWRLRHSEDRKTHDCCLQDKSDYCVNDYNYRGPEHTMCTFCVSQSIQNILWKSISRVHPNLLLLSWPL